MTRPRRPPRLRHWRHKPITLPREGRWYKYRCAICGHGWYQTKPNRRAQ